MKTKLTPEEDKLKKYIKENFPAKLLKDIGFTKEERSDYNKVAVVICDMLDLENIYEYDSIMLDIVDSGSSINGSVSDTVNAVGDFVQGGGFHLSMAAYDIDIICPICSKEQSVTISTISYSGTKKCKGCKRRIRVYKEKNGDIVIEEL